jgi:hypothetical protein
VFQEWTLKWNCLCLNLSCHFWLCDCGQVSLLPKVCILICKWEWGYYLLTELWKSTNTSFAEVLSRSSGTHHVLYYHQPLPHLSPWLIKAPRSLDLASEPSPPPCRPHSFWHISSMHQPSCGYMTLLYCFLIFSLASHQSSS